MSKDKSSRKLSLNDLKLAKEFGRIPKPGFRLVRSLGGGKVVEIKADTPPCCDPSSEVFWSM